MHAVEQNQPLKRASRQIKSHARIKLSWLGYIAFWAAVFLLNTGPHWEIYKTTRELLETAGLITALQFVTAFVTLKLLVPRFLDQDRKWVFAVTLVILVIAVSEINIVARVLYLEPMYPETYSVFLKNFGEMSLWQRMDLTWSLRYILFSKVPLFLLPTALLIAYHFHQDQQTTLRWREQKRSAELDALRNQLNPHFIFNTLNNIYALSLKKSEQTPLAIEKLSNILDYVVYRCNDKFVPLADEMVLIQNYLGLEKLRYGNRLEAKFVDNISVPTKIAPLLLLTLVENACKHGARNELNQARVDIKIATTNTRIIISVLNSKPVTQNEPSTSQPSVGLDNLTKQLALLYPDEHEIKIEDAADFYSVLMEVAHR